jgi:ADP-ribosyl-[dinitrogen reductase] hydrolase
MEEHELHHLEVRKLGDGVEARGMDWHLLPIGNGEVPDASFEKAWSYAGCRLRSQLSEGKGIVLHCKGGLGRTGTIAVGRRKTPL